MSIRILDFDSSLKKQERLLAEYSAEVVDLRDLGPQVRLWIDHPVKKELLNRIKNSQSNAVTFLGSGDFHHISYLLTDSIEDDFSLIVFDAHPDLDIVPPRLGCGSWVTHALKNRNIRKCILVGISLAGTFISAAPGDFDLIDKDRLELYPYSAKKKNGLILDKFSWRRLKGNDLKTFFLKVLKRIPARKAYVSIDKDCLKSEFALTNWEEGEFSLDELLLMLGLIKDNFDLIGMDITGDYSPSLNTARAKNFSAKGMPEDLILSVNQNTNLAILEKIGDVSIFQQV